MKRLWRKRTNTFTVGPDSKTPRKLSIVGSPLRTDAVEIHVMSVV